MSAIRIYYLTLLAVTLGTLVLLYGHLPPEVPLYYSLSWGEQQLADKWSLVYIPLIMIIYDLALGLVWKRYFLRDAFVGRIVGFVRVIYITLAFFAYVRIIILVL